MFPSSNSNQQQRDALRQVLHSSLEDVLTDVFLDAQQMAPSSTIGGNRHTMSQATLHQASLLTSPPDLSTGAAAHHFLASAGPTAASRAALAASARSLHGPTTALFGAGSYGGGGQDEFLLDQARDAMIKQRMISLQQKRQLLIEENRRRLLEDSYYMALLRNGMPSAAAAGPGLDLKHKASLLSFGQDSNIPLALLASQIVTSPTASMAGPAAASSAALNLSSLHSPGAAGLQPRMTDNKSTQQANTTKALEALGNSLRKKSDPYIDVSTITPTAEQVSTARRTRGGVAEPFPERLHRMLETCEKEGKTEVVSFFSHGRAFGVHDPDVFVEEIMPKYFKQSKWNSFARQLNLYGFIRITSGPDAGGYYHELFLRGRPHLCLHMRRVGVPLEGADRRKIKARGMTGTNAHGTTDPDFYAMQPVTSVSATAPSCNSNSQTSDAAASTPKDTPVEKS